MGITGLGGFWFVLCAGTMELYIKHIHNITVFACIRFLYFMFVTNVFKR
jgi:hypothetical protein